MILAFENLETFKIVFTNINPMEEDVEMGKRLHSLNDGDQSWADTSYTDREEFKEGSRDGMESMFDDDDRALKARLPNSVGEDDIRMEVDVFLDGIKVFRPEWKWPELQTVRLEYN